MPTVWAIAYFYVCEYMNTGRLWLVIYYLDEPKSWLWETCDFILGHTEFRDEFKFWKYNKQ